MNRARLLILLMCFSLTGAFAAQSRVPSPVRVTLGQSIVVLSGPWRFHIGDSLDWARPDYDDSSWETVDLAPPPGKAAMPGIESTSGWTGAVPGWAMRGHPGYWGYAWYRIAVQVSAPAGGGIAIAAPPDVDVAYQLFANGRLLGGTGQLSGGAGPQVTHSAALPEKFLLPPPSNHEPYPATLVLAFRVWTSPATLANYPEAGGLRSAPAIGGTAAIQDHTQLVDLEIVRVNAWHIGEGLLFLLLAITAAGLIFFDRSDPVYRWLMVVFALICMANSYEPLGWLRLESDRTGNLLESILINPAISGAWAMVWWRWFRLGRAAWIPRIAAGLTLLYAASEAVQEHILFEPGMHAAFSFALFASLAFRVLFFGLLILIVTWGIRQQGREGWLTVPAVFLLGVGQFQGYLKALHIPPAVYPFGIRFSLHQAADLVLIAVLGILTLRRLILSLRRQREMALDVNQAREVQSVLIPEELPRVPGWTIESEYRPAREVGGDFFQIIPLATAGSVLIVIGDVAGKGLQAGMLVALIVGTIRTMADNDPDPLHVLQTLNRRLCGRGPAHATCLALRVDEDGAATLANAGHLPPYLNGEELPMEGAIPLGMDTAAQFSMKRFHLEPDDRLMFLSDGVAEAQDEQGRLFGFERAEAMSNQAARAVAEAAQRFGQHDDISVLSIQRTVLAPVAVR